MTMWLNSTTRMPCKGKEAWLGLEEEAVGRSEAALSVMAKKFIKQRQLLAAKGFPCVPTILESPPQPLPDVLGNPPIPEGERARWRTWQRYNKSSVFDVFWTLPPSDSALRATKLVADKIQSYSQTRLDRQRCIRSIPHLSARRSVHEL
jgi:hypothetical protein